MKLAVIGSRTIVSADIAPHAGGATEIVSGGARGLDSLAARYAEEQGLKLTVFRPDYRQYGNPAPHIRNRQIVDYSDAVLAFWDGKSRGTKEVIDYARNHGKRVDVVRC